MKKRTVNCQICYKEYQEGYAEHLWVCDDCKKQFAKEIKSERARKTNNR